MAANLPSPTATTSESLTQSVDEARFVCRADKTIADVKRRARPELKGEPSWTQMGLHEKNVTNSSYFFENIDRISSSEMSMETFQRRYELPGKPVLITGLMKDWEAKKKWTIERLTKKYRNQKFKCGEDDDGFSVKLKMKYYRHYVQTTMDDSPLYVFDSGFGEHRKKKSLLEDYKVPDYFADDLFRFASESRRPPYRWFVMGPANSGTGIHIDPLGTSAWNAVVRGHKHWCIFPPNTPKELLKPQVGEGGHQRSEAVSWFRYVYPKCIMPSWPSEYRPYDFTHGPGEVVYVPGGWWHVVLNLDLSIAVTQNLVTPVTFHRVLPKTIKGRPKLAKKWLQTLRKYRPEIAREVAHMDLDAGTGLPSSSSSSCSSSSVSSCSESESLSNNDASSCDNSRGPATADNERRTQGMKRPIQLSHTSKYEPGIKRVKDSDASNEYS